MSSTSCEFTLQNVRKFFAPGLLLRNVHSVDLLDLVKNGIDRSVPPPYPKARSLKGMLRTLKAKMSAVSKRKFFANVLEFWVNCVFYCFNQAEALEEIHKELCRCFAFMPDARLLANDLAQPKNPPPPPVFDACLRLLFDTWLFVPEAKSATGAVDPPAPLTVGAFMSAGHPFMLTPEYKAKVSQPMGCLDVLRDFVRNLKFETADEFLSALRLPFSNCVDYGVETVAGVVDAAKSFVAFIDSRADSIRAVEAEYLEQQENLPEISSGAASAAESATLAHEEQEDERVEPTTIVTRRQRRKMEESKGNRRADGSYTEDFLAHVEWWSSQIALLATADDGYFSLFSKPVNLKLYPSYTMVVKNPMDLETIQGKIDSHAYDSVEVLLKDLRLVASNCRLFNKAHADLVRIADKFDRKISRRVKEYQKHFNVEVDDVMAPSATIVPAGSVKRGLRRVECTIPADVLREANHVMAQIQRMPQFQIFNTPVNQKVYTDYKDFVAVPMSFDVVAKKLSNKQYADEAAWAADMQLISDNCVAFNRGDPGMCALAGQLQAKFADMRAALHKKIATQKQALASRAPVGGGEAHDNETTTTQHELVPTKRARIESDITGEKSALTTSVEQASSLKAPPLVRTSSSKLKFMLSKGDSKKRKFSSSALAQAPLQGSTAEDTSTASSKNSTAPAEAPATKSSDTGSSPAGSGPFGKATSSKSAPLFVPITTKTTVTRKDPDFPVIVALLLRPLQARAGGREDLVLQGFQSGFNKKDLEGLSQAFAEEHKEQMQGLEKLEERVKHKSFGDRLSVLRESIVGIFKTAQEIFKGSPHALEVDIFAKYFLEMTQRLCDNYKAPDSRDSVRRRLFELRMRDVEDLIFTLPSEDGSAQQQQERISIFHVAVLVPLRGFLKKQHAGFVWTSPVRGNEKLGTIQAIADKHLACKYQEYGDLVRDIDAILEAAAAVQTSRQAAMQGADARRRFDRLLSFYRIWASRAGEFKRRQAEFAVKVSDLHNLDNDYMEISDARLRPLKDQFLDQIKKAMAPKKKPFDFNAVGASVERVGQDQVKEAGQPLASSGAPRTPNLADQLEAHSEISPARPTPNRDDATMPAPRLGRRHLGKIPGFPSPQGSDSSKTDSTSPGRAKAIPIKFEWRESTIRKAGSKHAQEKRPSLQLYFSQSPTSAIDDSNLEELHAQGTAMGLGGKISDGPPALLVALCSATRKWLPASSKKLSEKQPTNAPITIHSDKLLNDSRLHKPQLSGLRFQDVSRIAMADGFAVDAITLYFDDSTATPERIVLDAIKQFVQQDHCHRQVVDWKSKMRCLQNDVEWYLRYRATIDKSDCEIFHLTRNGPSGKPLTPSRVFLLHRLDAHMMAFDGPCRLLDLARSDTNSSFAWHEELGVYLCSDTYCDGGRGDSERSTQSCSRVRVFAMAGWLAFAAPTPREATVTQ